MIHHSLVSPTYFGAIFQSSRVSLSFEANPCCKSKFFLSCLTTLKMKHHVWLSLNGNSGETKLTTCK
uniref:Uncharacterized protein n=1 Tax=Populus trichocarpa TaxID=3694 RepID=U5GV73_POPTR